LNEEKLKMSELKTWEIALLPDRRTPESISAASIISSILEDSLIDMSTQNKNGEGILTFDVETLGHEYLDFFFSLFGKKFPVTIGRKRKNSAYLQVLSKMLFGFDIMVRLTYEDHIEYLVLEGLMFEPKLSRVDPSRDLTTINLYAISSGYQSIQTAPNDFITFSFANSRTFLESEVGVPMVEVQLKNKTIAIDMFELVKRRKRLIEILSS